MVTRSARHLVVDLDRDVDQALVEELLAVERECCPFFELGWEPLARRLRVSVSQPDHEPALDAVEFALDVQSLAAHSSSP